MRCLLIINSVHVVFGVQVSVSLVDFFALPLVVKRSQSNYSSYQSVRLFSTKVVYLFSSILGQVDY